MALLNPKRFSSGMGDATGQPRVLEARRPLRGRMGLERSFFPGVSPRGGSTPRLLTFRPLACWSRRWGEGFRRWVQRGDPSTMSPPLPDSPTPELGMSDHLNPQRDQMADESMVRTLAAQAAAIWEPRS